MYYDNDSRYFVGSYYHSRVVLVVLASTTTSYALVGVCTFFDAL